MKLIERAADDDAFALAELSSSPEAGEQIVRRLRSNQAPYWPLAKVLVDVVDSSIERDLIELFETAQNMDVALIAARALVRVASAEGVAALIGGLEGARRGIAIDALGDARLGEARAALESELHRLLDATGLTVGLGAWTPNEDIDPSEVELVPAVLRALGRLGVVLPEHEILIPLLRLEVADPYFGSEAIRAGAAQALRIVVVEGMVGPLRDFIEAASSSECANAALDALFFLGTKEALQAITVHATRKTGVAQPHAIYRLRDLVGPVEGPDPSPEELLAASHRMMASMTPNVCHRAGVPFRIDVLAQALSVHERRVAVLEEVEVVTAAWIGYDRYFGEADWIDYPRRLRAWLEAHRTEYNVGGLYKRGQLVTPPGR